MTSEINQDLLNIRNEDVPLPNEQLLKMYETLTSQTKDGDNPNMADDDLLKMYQNLLSQGGENPDGSSMSDEDVLKMYQNLMALQSNGGDVNSNPLAKSVAPTPGCCVKTKNMETNEKIFLNICTSSDIPAPPEISEEDLKELIDKIDDENNLIDYKIPMGIGEPHAEVENKGQGCTAYDIVISPSFLHKINNNKIFFGFFMSVVFEGILNKYSITMDRNWNVMKKRKFFGRLAEQNIRQRRLVQEMGGNIAPEITSKGEKPEFVIMREPEDGHPQFLITEIKLPQLTKANAISLEVGEDCLLMSARPHMYYLNIYLPFKLVQGECGSQFNLSTKVLTVTMPVQPE